MNTIGNVILMGSGHVSEAAKREHADKPGEAGRQSMIITFLGEQVEVVAYPHPDDEYFCLSLNSGGTCLWRAQVDLFLGEAITSGNAADELRRREI